MHMTEQHVCDMTLCCSTTSWKDRGLLRVPQGTTRNSVTFQESGPFVATDSSKNYIIVNKNNILPCWFQFYQGLFRSAIPIRC